MRQYRELIEIPADGFQLGEHRLQLVHRIDCPSECCTEKIFALGQSRLRYDLFDLPPLDIGCPEGYFFVAFAVGFV